jgi:hypothetical protein
MCQPALQANSAFTNPGVVHAQSQPTSHGEKCASIVPSAHPPDTGGLVVSSVGSAVLAVVLVPMPAALVVMSVVLVLVKLV